MPLIKPRTRGKQLVRHIARLDRETNETILRVNIEELRSTGMSFMPEGLEKQIDVQAMADLLEIKPVVVP